MEQKAAQLFNRGMNRDRSISKADTEFAFDNHNIRITARDHDTLLSVTNERGNRRVENLQFQGTLIGWNTLNNYLILFTTDGTSNNPDRIYRVKYFEGDFSSILLFNGCLNFDAEYPIESLTDFENDDILKIYWLDGRNVLRSMNFSDSYLQKHLTEGSTLDNPTFSFASDNTWFDSTRGTDSIPSVIIEKDNGGNKRQNGVIQYLVTYYNKNGIQTGIIYASPLVYLSPSDGSSSAEEFNSNKITLSLSGLDQTFDYVRVYAILRTSYNITNSAFIVGESAVSEGVVRIVDSGNTLTPIDLTSLMYVGSRRVVASTLTQKDGTLFLGDISSVGNKSIEGIEEAVKDYAFVGGEFHEGQSWESNLITFKYSEENSETANTTDIPYVYPSGLYPFNSQLQYLSSEITTFKGGEKYRFAVKFLRNNGESSKAFWIGDKVNPLYPKITDNASVRRAVAVCTLPYAIVKAASEAGYTSAQLLIAEALYSDRSVKAQGIVNPTVFNILDRYKDAPYAQASWIYRAFGGKLSNKHFETLHRSDSISAELQNSWWEDGEFVPSPLYITDDSGELVNIPYSYKQYDKIQVTCDVYAYPQYPIPFSGTLFVTFVKTVDGVDVSTTKSYVLNGGLPVSQAEFINNWLHAYETAEVPIVQRATKADMEEACHLANVAKTLFSPGHYEYKLSQSGPVAIDYSTSSVGESYAKTSREYFFVDQSIVTLNSPEFDYEAVNIDKVSSLKFRIVGAARITGSISDYSILTDNFEYPGEKVADISLNTSNISSSVRSLAARPLYMEYYEQEVNNETILTKSPYSFMTYMWHKTGSIPEVTYKEKQLSVLKNKIFANMYFSYYSVYNNYRENIWEKGNIDVRQFNAVSEQLYELSVGEDKRLYTANVDKVVTMPNDATYPIFYTEEYGSDSEDLSLIRSEEGSISPIQMTYHSKPHAVISLPRISGKDTILPYMFESDKYSVPSTDGSSTFGPYIPWEGVITTKQYLYRECVSTDPDDLSDISVGSYTGLILNGTIDTTEHKISLKKNLQLTGGSSPEALKNLLDSVSTVTGNTSVYAMMYFGNGITENVSSPLVVDMTKALITDVDISVTWTKDIITGKDKLSFLIKSSGEGMSAVTYTVLGQNSSEQEILNIEDTETRLEAESGIYSFDVLFNSNSSLIKLIVTFDIDFYGLAETLDTNEDEIDLIYDENNPQQVISGALQKTWYFSVEEASYLDPGITGGSLDFTNLFDRKFISISNSEYTIGVSDSGRIYPTPEQLPYYLPTDNIKEGDSYVYIGELYEDFDAEVSEHPEKDTRYGGITESAVESNTFVVAGERVPLPEIDDDDPQSLCLIGDEGDTFFQRWDSIKAYPRSNVDMNQVLNGMSVMLETHINIEGRNDIDRGTTRLTDISIENFGALNPVYSQRNNFSSSYDTDEVLNLDTYGNCITWTMQKNSAADVDEWTHVTLASSLSMDGDKGKVNALRRFQNSIISFQDRGIAEILFNSRTQIATQEGVPIEIANSGKVEGKRYITAKYGTSNKWSIIEGKTGLFFVDNFNKIIGLFNGQGVESLSTKSNLDAWVRDNNSTKPWTPAKRKNIVSFYDKIHSDVYFINSSNVSQPCLVYSEILGGFVGFYDYSDVPMMTNIEDKFISFHRIKNFNSGALWLQNEGLYGNFFGEWKDFWITWRVTPDNFSDKIWTNLEYRADFMHVLGNDGHSIVNEQELIDGDRSSVVADKTFDLLEVWNEYQTTGEQSIPSRVTGLKPDVYSDANRLFRIWRMDIPRATPNVTLGNRFGLDRIRNPWVYVKLKKNRGNFGQDMMQLHDVIVKYFSNK